MVPHKFIGYKVAPNQYIIGWIQDYVVLLLLSFLISKIQSRLFFNNCQKDILKRIYIQILIFLYLHKDFFDKITNVNKKMSILKQICKLMNDSYEQNEKYRFVKFQSTKSLRVYVFIQVLTIVENT